MTTERRWEIVWPERRMITERQIRMAYSDAVANGDCSDTGLNDPDEMLRELDDAGIYTMGRQS